ncbi:phosphoenolpyruvate--protein phosphotransferase [Acidaminobacter sp. JC074]|uniref:phosphoenolpyruvate--protein phosphotransferase n=1 Tax=Acidaminobacter sp. JC074 TaxID=2530199 RepID=UPI001F0F21EC|nr:phosphoenolpyruvate--protein phosphotransferase [Acidaminobacter sp. JC074]MCH4889531.1 phosphoenolpyruvate--protein phosphotransferase [Acidaminobacter sp. JC074]
MSGSIVSRGIAIGRVMRIEPYKPVGLIKTEDTEGAKSLLLKSMTQTSEELNALVDKTRENVGDHEAAIFEAHLMILSDPTLLPQIESIIEHDSLSAASAVESVLSSMEDMFKNLDSDYMKERALDIYDIKKRWVKNILSPTDNNISLSSGVILVAEELTPSDTLELDMSKVEGLLMEKGGLTSHTAILAQSMDIPAMVGCGSLENLTQNTMLILDARQGEIILDFDDKILSDYQKLKEEEAKEKEALKRFVDVKGQTKDGKRVEIASNIAGIDDIKGVHENGGEGVGLFRTEFVYMNRSSAPTEEEQFKIYKKIVEGLKGKPIIFRTMDIGGDKEVPYLNMPAEPNPFLGFRAVRYCLQDKNLFKAQIRAILRASAYGSIKIMFPMIGSIRQFLDAKALVETCKNELKSEGIKINDVPLGIMIEIPSAAILSEEFAKYVDFFSIGTNDLTQYTLAVDRQNESVSELYDYFDPAVLSLIQHVIKVANKTKTWVGMCGSAAGDPLMIPLLVSWGIDEISMASSQILKAKQIVSEMTLKPIEMEQIMACYDAKAVRALFT